jgi:hypothetical protein
VHYFLVFQVLCGLFGAFVAGRKGRSKLLWAAMAAAVPVAGVVWVLLLPERRAPRAGPVPAGPPRRRPARCCGEFRPDCLGCPYFRRDLFGHDTAAGNRGRCTFYQKHLVAGSEEGRRRDT